MPISKPYDETKVLELVAAGDELAFEALYRHYRNKAYAIALTYMSSPSLAEDVLQEFFLILWRKRETLIGVAHFEQYFFVVLRNMLISELRKKESQLKIKKHLEQTAILQLSPSQTPEADELKQIIQHAIKQLPEKQQRIYQMSREEGLSHEEIGHRLQLSHRTVSNTLSLILNYLRNILRGLGYLPAVIITIITG